MPRYVYVYDGWRHGEKHPDDSTAVEAVDEMHRRGSLIRIERMPSEGEPDAGGSAPECRGEGTPPAAEVVWRAVDESEGESQS
ncbi:MAG: hypothetical protein ABEL76_06010 [Bradymonadaceae bacterium]